MLIKEGTILRISHGRKGNFNAIALKDFSLKDEFYPVAVCQEVEGRNTVWEEGEKIPCKGSFCTVKVLETPTVNKGS